MWPKNTLLELVLFLHFVFPELEFMSQPGMVVHTFNPSTPEAETGDLCEFEASQTQGARLSLNGETAKESPQ